MNEQQTPEKKSGVSSWKYSEGLFVSLILVFIGLIIEFATGGKGTSMPAWPANLLILVLFIAYIVVFYFLVNLPLKKWLSGVPAAISAICTFAFLVFLMGFIPQEITNHSSPLMTRLGLNHIVRSWPYLLSSTYLLFVLGLTIIRRIRPFSFKNISFLLNHLGLWIIIVAGSLGSADSMKLSMVLSRNKETIAAYNSHSQAFDLGFRLQLINFTIDEYPPELGLLSAKTGKSVNPDATRPEVKKGTTTMMGDWCVEITDFIENAKKDSAGYLPAANPGAPAAYITAKKHLQNITVSGWVSSGSPFVNRQDLMLSDNEFIAMTLRKPKKFISEIRAFYDDTQESFQLTVNKPYKFKGWTIYQSGYDEQMGKWSEISIVQLVRDPWLPVVYTGIFMLLAGALLMLWTGRSGTKKQQITI